MADQTIFQGQSRARQANPPTQASNVPPSPPPTSLSTNQEVSSPPSPIPPSPEPSQSAGKGGPISIKTIRFFVGLATFIVVLVLLFFVASKLLGNKESSVTLTYWGLWEDPNVVSSVISDFERQNPNIKVEYSRQDIRDYRERLVTRIEEGSGPDVFRFHNSWYPMLKAFLLPMPESVISREEFNNNYYPVAKEDLVKNGAIYGVPLHIDTLSLYVNKEMFEAAGIPYPKTWEEFRDAAYQLTVKDEEGNIRTSGAAIGTFENVSHSPDLISLLLIQNGVDVYNLSADKRLYDALSFYASFSEGDGIWNNALDNSLVAFSKGNLAMFFGYSWDFFSIKALNPDLAFEVIAAPQLESDSPKTLASYWAEGVSTESKHKKEAFIFLKFMSSKEVQEKLFTEASKVRPFGQIYSHKSLSSKLKDHKDLSAFISQAPNAYSSYFVSDTYDNGLNERLNTYLKDAVNAILAGASEESVSETLIQGYNQVLDQYENPKD